MSETDRGNLIKNETRYRARRQGRRMEWVSGTGVKFTPRGAFLYRNSSGGWIKIDPATLGRCTGRRDRKGVLIWEGDLIRSNEGTGPVNWLVCYGAKTFLNGKTHVGFSLEHVGSMFERRYSWMGKTELTPTWGLCEVVGNIHEKEREKRHDRRGAAVLRGAGGEATDGPGSAAESEGGRKDREAAE